MNVNTRPVIDTATAYITQVRLHYRMPQAQWDTLPDMAKVTLMTAFAQRVRTAYGIEFEAWDKYPFERKTQLGRKFNQGEK